MSITIIITFIIAYAMIIFQQYTKLDNAIPALLGAAIIWAAYALNTDAHIVEKSLVEHISGVAGIVFFVWGALTIVELTATHDGFKLITDFIGTRNPRKLIWVTSMITFFLAAIIDNLTAAVVMTALLRNIIKNAEERAFFACMAVVTANAGGTWSPLGEITTTMLWSGGQISISNIMKEMFIPSLVCALVPLTILGFTLKTELATPSEIDLKEIAEKQAEETQTLPTSAKDRNIMLAVCMISLLFVPVFKYFTHLPPYMGMICSLGLVWLTSEILHSNKDHEERKQYSVAHALTKVNTTNLFFFLGILLAVSGMEATGILKTWGDWLFAAVPNILAVDFVIGLISAVVDNVPLVALMQGMYSLAEYPIDHPLWIYLSYTAGTGGSILVIGSAAGVGVMGQEPRVITFGWFFRKISLLALIGYCAGAAIYLPLKWWVY